MIMWATPPLIALVLLSAVAVGTAGASPPEAVTSHVVLATVEHRDRTLEFVQSLDGTVGVAEIAPVGTPSLLAGAARDASPAELFRAVAPDRPVPPALLAGRGDRASRGLDIAPSPSNATGGTVDAVGEAYCEQGSAVSQFATDWHEDIGQHADFSHIAPLHQSVYDGFAMEAGDTTARWLGVCRGEQAGTKGVHWSTFQFKAQRFNGNYWANVYTTLLDPGYRVIYHSTSLGSEQWRIHLHENYTAMCHAAPEDCLRRFSVAIAGIEPIEGFVLPPRGSDGGGGRGGDVVAPRGAGSDLAMR